MALTAELIQLSDTQYHAHEFSRIPHYSNSIGKKILTKSPQHAWLDHPILNPFQKAWLLDTLHSFITRLCSVQLLNKYRGTRLNIEGNQIEYGGEPD